MPKRYLYIWFPFFVVNLIERQHPELRQQYFLLYGMEHGRMVVRFVNSRLAKGGITTGMAVADVRAIFPDVVVRPDIDEGSEKLLVALGRWCFRYTPVVATDLKNGLILDTSGCTHLWGGEKNYLQDIEKRFQRMGFAVSTAIADTITIARGIARYGNSGTIVGGEEQVYLFGQLHPSALVLEKEMIHKLEKLGFYQIRQLFPISGMQLRRRFGSELSHKLEQALGMIPEILKPIRPLTVFCERLVCMEPIKTSKGIKIALTRLLEQLTTALLKARKGIRHGIFRAYRLDGRMIYIEIGTNRASRNVKHLYSLFELKISQLEPAEGIELFELEATLIEELDEKQETFWETGNSGQTKITELLDCITGKLGTKRIHRYLPQESNWPERSIRDVNTLNESSSVSWNSGLSRPVHLLADPRPIEVMVPLPDYPPVQFRYQGVIIRIKRADGPERIEQEWWIQSGVVRDYYRVEDERGIRYWLFRSGTYEQKTVRWFLHGFFV